MCHPAAVPAGPHSIPEQRVARRASAPRLVATLVFGLVLSLSLGGCATQGLYRQAQAAEQAGDYDQAVLKYLEAVRANPDKISYRAALLRAKVQASQNHVRRGKRFLEADVLERALVEFRQAIELDPTNQYAEAELQRVIERLAARRSGGESVATIAEMKREVRGVRAQPPVLNPRSDEPIDLIFSKPASVLDIYRALGKAFGVNVLFDPKIKDQEISIELTDVNAQSALEILMRTVGHFYKVLDESSIIIADDTPQNRRNYEDQVIQTFFLDNAEVKDVMTMVRSLIGAKHVAANEQLNAIVLRDTADKVKVAEQIILANDKAKAEVVVDVELLQINTSELQNIGAEFGARSITTQLDVDGNFGNADPLRLSDIQYLNQNNWFLTLPSVTYNLIKDDSDAQTLAQPKLRITEGEKASLVIGDRVPIPTTSFNSNNINGGGIVPVTSFQYQDIGIKIDVEPRVHHNEEVTMKVKVEVSNIANFIPVDGGPAQPVIGTRTIETNIRLRDGETNFLAGLIRNDESQTEAGLAGLSDLPILGRLFKSVETDNRRTDIVLTLTPHVIRRAAIEEADLLPIWAGTEQNITFRGGSPQVESGVSGPFDEDDARTRVRERLRERLRSLPRGLQESGDEDVIDDGANGDPGPQPGIELAPTGGFNDPFADGDQDDAFDDDGDGNAFDDDDDL